MNIVALAVALAFTPAEAMAPAVRTAMTVQVAPSPTVTWPEVGGPCAEWADLAFEAGWPVDDWPTLSRVMWCESNCRPEARNKSGASGLLQLMPGWWRGIGDPYDPQFNLSRGLEVKHAQGWRAWSCY